MSRSHMARANFKKYTEITNPLATSQTKKLTPVSRLEPSTTATGDASDNVPGPKPGDKTPARVAPKGDGDEEDDPFGLGAIMSRGQAKRTGDKRSPQNVRKLAASKQTGGDVGAGSDREAKNRRPDGGTAEGDDDDEEEEDPFGLGAIMASEQKAGTPGAKGGGATRDQDGRDETHTGSRTSGTKRSAPSQGVNGGGSRGTHEASLKAPRIGGYFSESPLGAGGGVVDRRRECNRSGQSEPGPSFVPALKFEGQRQGYVFKSGSLGLGYYLDENAGDTRRGSDGRRTAAAGAAGTAVPDAHAPAAPVTKAAQAATAPESSKDVAKKAGMAQERAAVDVPAALQRLGPLLLKPKKAAKAASLLADLMQAEMRPDNARLFLRAIRPLAEEPTSEAALACGGAGARVFRLLLERAEWLGDPANGVRAVTWELVFGLRHEVKTDDSFQFARAVKRLRQAIEALGDGSSGGSGWGSGVGAEDGAGGDGSGGGREAGLTLSLERKRALIEIMKEAFKSYHLAWARSSIEPAFKAAADRRRLFPEGTLRETLDGFTDVITKRQRNPGGAIAPPTRTIRAHNSVAHPTLNKRSDVIR